MNKEQAIIEGERRFKQLQIYIICPIPDFNIHRVDRASFDFDEDIVAFRCRRVRQIVGSEVEDGAIGVDCDRFHRTVGRQST